MSIRHLHLRSRAAITTAFTAIAFACLHAAQAGTPASQWPITAQQRSSAHQAAQQGIPESELKPNAPDVYVVKRGDTLWGISGLYLPRPWRWPALWGMNLDTIRNPHRIYPGQTLYLERRNGFARLSTSRGGRDGGDDVVHLSPSVRSTSLAHSALPTISPRLIEPFLVEPEILAQGESERAPHIVGARQDHSLLSPGDRLYARSDDGQTLRMGNEPVFYRVFREAVPLRDPDTGAVLGYEAQYLGKVQLMAGERQEAAAQDQAATPVPASLNVISAKEEIRIGDRLLPMPRLSLNNYVPHAPDTGLQARVVSIYGSNAVAYAARNNVIAINRGAQDGVELGHVFRLLSRGDVVKDKIGADNATIKLPDEVNGLAMVFRIFDRVSYALILDAREGVKVGDGLVSPEAALQ